jgi:S-adenosylmethionine hydrolase
VPPVITFLSDYGTADEFVGVVHGVIARVCPEARIIDVTHGVPRQAVGAGALILARTLPYMPAGVHLAVVDPEVGAARRAIALRTAEEDRLLVGPDNGLLLPAAERFGGVAEAVEVSRSPWRLEPVSATFHGRDLFAPVAARLAAGSALAEAGPPVDAAELVPADLARPHREPDGRLVAHVVAVDRFGNVQLDVGHQDLAGSPVKLGRALAVQARERRLEMPFVRTFADVREGEAMLFEDSAGMLAVAVNGGDAADELGLAAGDEVRIAAA